MGSANTVAVSHLPAYGKGDITVQLENVMAAIPWSCQNIHPLMSSSDTFSFHLQLTDKP